MLLHFLPFFFFFGQQFKSLNSHCCWSDASWRRSNIYCPVFRPYAKDRLEEEEEGGKNANTETDASSVLLPPQAQQLTVPLEGLTSPQTKGVIWKIAQYVCHTARLGSLEREVRCLLGPPHVAALSIFSELNPDRRAFSSPNCGLGNIINLSHFLLN